MSSIKLIIWGIAVSFYSLSALGCLKSQFKEINDKLDSLASTIEQKCGGSNPNTATSNCKPLKYNSVDKNNPKKVLNVQYAWGVVSQGDYVIFLLGHITL